MDYLKNIAIVIGLLLSLSTLWSWGQKIFSKDLVARMEPATFALPPQLELYYLKTAKDLSVEEAVPRILSSSSVATLYDMKDIPEEGKKRLVEGLVQLLTRGADIVMPYEFRSLQGSWSGVIRNDSSVTLNKVQLYLRSATLARLKKSDNSMSAQRVANIVDIGDLRPAESVDVMVWTDSLPIYHLEDDIKITHSSGVGTVTIPRSVVGLAALLDKYVVIFYLILAWLFIGLVVPIAVKRLSKG